MTGSSSTGKVIGAATGVAVSASALPHTAGNDSLQVLALAIGVSSGLVLVSTLIKLVLVKLS